jgi:hypothetical protein
LQSARRKRGKAKIWEISLTLDMPLELNGHSAWSKFVKFINIK